MPEKAEAGAPKNVLGQKIAKNSLYRLYRRQSVIRVVSFEPGKADVVRGVILNFPKSNQALIPPISGHPNGVKISAEIIGARIEPVEALDVFLEVCDRMNAYVEAYFASLVSLLGLPEVSENFGGKYSGKIADGIRQTYGEFFRETALKL